MLNNAEVKFPLRILAFSALLFLWFQFISGQILFIQRFFYSDVNGLTCFGVLLAAIYAGVDLVVLYFYEILAIRFSTDSKEDRDLQSFVIGILFVIPVCSNFFRNSWIIARKII